MTPLVIDSSVALAWVMPDEQSAEADALFEILEAEDVVTPSHFGFEVANALEMNVRRRRIDRAYCDQALVEVLAFPIRHEPHPSVQRLHATLDLARRYELTIYDAAYLETAMRLRAGLASFDGDLRDAAIAEGVGLRV